MYARSLLVLFFTLIFTSIASAEPIDIKLPTPQLESSNSLEEALANRRSVRDYSNESLSLEQLGQLLWAGQGISGKVNNRDHRTAPSAGALYPIELLFAANNVDGLNPGIYRYFPKNHRIKQVLDGDITELLSKAALSQESIQNAPLVMIVSGIYERETKKYKRRGRLYTHIEVGIVSQNIVLQAQSLGLGAVMVGGFQPKQVAQVVQLRKNEIPFLLISIGSMPKKPQPTGQE